MVVKDVRCLSPGRRDSGVNQDRTNAAAVGAEGDRATVTRLLSAVGRQAGRVDELKLRYRDEDRPLTGIPTNPYTRERYRSGKDLFYLPEYLDDSGLYATVNRNDSLCPYVGLAAPGGVPGTIVIVGWSPPESRGSPIEFAVVGYGHNTAEPMRRGRGFFVLLN